MRAASARLAAAFITPSGLLFMASCSHNVEPASFSEAVRRGLEDARRGGPHPQNERRRRRPPGPSLASGEGVPQGRAAPSGLSGCGQFDRKKRLGRDDTEPTFPKLAANRTRRGIVKIDAIDPERK